MVHEVEQTVIGIAVTINQQTLSQKRPREISSAVQALSEGGNVLLSPLERALAVETVNLSWNYTLSYPQVRAW